MRSVLLEKAKELNYETIDEAFVDLYVKKRFSLEQIASFFEISRTTIQRYLLANGILLRSRLEAMKEVEYNHYLDLLSQAKELGYETVDEAFADLYVKKEKSLREVGEIFDLTPYTVKNHLAKVGVKRRPKGRPKKME